MKIFVNMRKRMLQKKVYKYTLKTEDLKSQSSCFLKLSSGYCEKNEQHIRIFGHSEGKYLEKEQEYKFKGEHYKHLSQIYEAKKKDAEIELKNLTCKV